MRAEFAQLSLGLRLWIDKFPRVDTTGSLSVCLSVRRFVCVSFVRSVCLSVRPSVVALVRRLATGRPSVHYLKLFHVVCIIYNLLFCVIYCTCRNLCIKYRTKRSINQSPLRVVVCVVELFPQTRRPNSTPDPGHAAQLRFFLKY